MKRYVSALLYALEIPFGVWAGLEIDRGHVVLGCALIAVIMAIVFGGVLLFMDAQVERISEEVRR